MKINNPFRRKPTTALYCASAEELQTYANAFVESVITSADPERARIIELAVKNGSLSLNIEILPTPGVRINLDPGAPISFDVLPS